MAAERGHRTHDGTEVARVGDAVERDDEREAGRLRVEQVVGWAYSYGGTCRASPWWTAAVGDPVELAARRLEDRYAALGRDLQRLADAVVDVDPRRRRTSSSPGRSARSASTTALRPATTSAARLAARGPGDGAHRHARPGGADRVAVARRLRGVVLAVGRLRRGALALQALAALASRADRSGPSCRRLRTAPRRCELPAMSVAVRVTAGQAPPGPDVVSSIAMPAAVSSVADRIGGVEVPCGTGLLALGELRRDEGVERDHRVGLARSPSRRASGRRAG